jgi:hypothetical protein
MSIEARQGLCDRLAFQDDSQRSDLMNPNLTQTDLIALLIALAEDWNIEVTAVRSDHHDDSALGEHSHANGWCIDLWPLASAAAGDYLDAGDPRFAAFLEDVAKQPQLYQIGLAGSAWTSANAVAAGGTVFHDDGADHVHIGAK